MRQLAAALGQRRQAGALQKAIATAEHLLATRADASADTSALERDHRHGGTGIEQPVYRLYGLTAEEIRIVEEGTK